MSKSDSKTSQLAIASNISAGSGVRVIREMRRPLVSKIAPTASRAVVGKATAGAPPPAAAPRPSIARLASSSASGMASVTAAAAAAAAASAAAELRARRETAKRVKQLLIRHVELADALLDEGAC